MKAVVYKVPTENSNEKGRQELIKCIREKSDLPEFVIKKSEFDDADWEEFSNIRILGSTKGEVVHIIDPVAYWPLWEKVKSVVKGLLCEEKK